MKVQLPSAVSLANPVREYIKKAKKLGIHTTLDTSGNPYTEEGPWHEKWEELRCN